MKPKKYTGEHWTKVIRHTMEEPAWRALSSTAQALYPWIKFEWRGVDANNNGKLRLSVRQAAACMGDILEQVRPFIQGLIDRAAVVTFPEGEPRPPLTVLTGGKKGDDPEPDAAA